MQPAEKRRIPLPIMSMFDELPAFHATYERVILTESLIFTPGWLVAASSCVVYAFIVAAAQLVFSTPTRSLDGVMYAHNLLLALYSAAVTVFMAYTITNEDLWSLTEMACRPIKNTFAHWVMFSFTVSKIWEWADTVFLVARGRPLRWVHLIHHATTLWLFMLTYGYATSTIGVLLNSGVHAVMYWHYAVPLPKACRP